MIGMTARQFHNYLHDGKGPPPHMMGKRKVYKADEVLAWVKTINRQPTKARKGRATASKENDHGRNKSDH